MSSTKETDDGIAIRVNLIPSTRADIILIDIMFCWHHKPFPGRKVMEEND